MRGMTPRRAVSRRAVLAAFLGAGAVGGADVPVLPRPRTELPSRARTLERYAGRRSPAWFGLEGPGVVSSFASDDEVVLTFDACGGPQLDYDADLIAVLRRHRAPATLFVNRQWALANWRVLTELVDDPLFEIANHGDRHVPLSAVGEPAYGIAGTPDVGAAYDEIARAHRLLRLLWNHRSRWFRPGTAHVDDVCAELAQELGTPVVGFTVNADSGATAPATQVEASLLTLQPGRIALGHMNLSLIHI